MVLYLVFDMRPYLLCVSCHQKVMYLLVLTTLSKWNPSYHHLKIHYQPVLFVSSSFCLWVMFGPTNLTVAG